MFDQAANVDVISGYNVAVERQFWMVDYRLKMKTLQAVSRFMKLVKVKNLRDGIVSQFRTFKKEVEAKMRLELE